MAERPVFAAACAGLADALVVLPACALSGSAAYSPAMERVTAEEPPTSSTGST